MEFRIVSFFFHKVMDNTCFRGRFKKTNKLLANGPSVLHQNQMSNVEIISKNMLCGLVAIRLGDRGPNLMKSGIGKASLRDRNK